MKRLSAVALVLVAIFFAGCALVQPRLDDPDVKLVGLRMLPAQGLQQKIAEAQAKLDSQKQSLRLDIRTMYIDGQLSTIEQLATSKNLSDYVDKQEISTTIQNKINAQIKEIAALQAQLTAEKGKLDVLVDSQKQQNAQQEQPMALQKPRMSATSSRGSSAAA